MLRSKLRAVIFDLDGVLVSTEQAHFAGWLAVARELGVKFTVEDNNNFRGVPRQESLALLAREAAPLDTAREQYLLQLKAQVYRNQITMAGHSIKIAGVDALLSGLREMGVRIGVASASRHALELLELAGLLGLIDAVTDGHFPGKPKPAPDQLFFISEKLEIPPQWCVVVEDSRVGLEAAQKAGMDWLAIGHGHGLDVPAFKQLDSLAGISADRFFSFLL